MLVRAPVGAMQEMQSLALLGQGCQPLRRGSMFQEVASFVCTFLSQTSDKYTVKCRFLARLLSPSIPLL